ncbi:NADPH:quinone reductase-like Zn-dependent oxidoreductase [Advenella incenata]|uniref:NADPH:quinone reductase-like Zn-dependent oxidoreductase n=1 Tax=Advenella incenata TaxID=267800 RepID=A0A4Q7V6K0_9BURK|nr:quinone oxidoreductase [Advenella incenata]RZT92231.1 NADPH:quinone reductase-like Zn-dependent oxidoreductase [Advenella incenata]
MRAIKINRYGGQEVVRYENDVPIPQPREGEVLVAIACAGINFMDIHTRQGKYENSRTYAVRAPCTLGMEGAGTIVALGEGVDFLQVGQRVAWCISWGSFAEYASVPASLIAVIPEEIGFDVAAAAMFQGCTAHYLVNDVAQLKQGMDCLVHAASGSIGQILIQMAKLAGATVYATASSEEKRATATERGADVVLPYEGGLFADRVRDLTSGSGVHVVFDSLGKTTLRDSMRATRTRGLVINYGNVSGSVDDLDPYELGERGSLFLTRPRLADYMAGHATVQRRADAIFSAILDRQLVIDIADCTTFEEIPSVHAAIEARQQIGKCVAWIGPRDVSG